MKKEVRALKKKLAKNTAQDQKARQRINAEMERLKKGMAGLRGKRSKKQLSEYNLFVRRQILDGKTFNQAVNLWKKLRRWEEGQVPTKTRIKTVVRRVASKPKIVVRRIKSKPKVIVKIRTRTKKVLVPSKAKIKYRYRTKTVVKTRVVKSKPKIEYKTRIVEKPVYKTVEKPVYIESPSRLAALEGGSTTDLKRLHSVSAVQSAFSQTLAQNVGRDLPIEEVAYRMLKVYFEELARTGFKRQMTLDDLIDAFVYSMYRVEKQLGKKPMAVHNEENAYRIINLYYIELARLGHKRALSLDELLEAYFYTFDRLGKDNTDLIRQMESMRMQQAAPVTTVVTEKKTEMMPVQTTTTTTMVSNNPQ